MTYNQLTQEDFIKKAKEIHGDKYDYSKVKYINNHTKVCIICHEHGEFWQTPASHLQGCGCPVCANKKKKLKHLSNTEDFIKKAKEIHGDKYDYSKVKYERSSVPVCIICTEHGEFYQTPNNHLRGQGCQKCYNEKRGISQRLTTENFIQKAKEVHGNEYDYSKVKYFNCNTKICIICHNKDNFGNEHGEFWQRPDHHLSSKCGCPKCKQKHLEEPIKNTLIENNIKFEQEKTFKWLYNVKTGCHQYLDFYLPEYNIAIECQGEQHFDAVKIFGGYEEFSKTKQRDINKSQKCEENNVKILYFGKNKFKKFMNEKEYFSNKNKLIKKIMGLS